MDELASEYNLSCKQRDDEIEIVGQVKVDYETTKLRVCIDIVATEFTIEAFGIVIILCDEISTKEILEMIETIKLGVEEDSIYCYSSSTFKSTDTQIKTMIPPQKTLSDIISIIKQTQEKKLSITTLVQLREIQDFGRKGFNTRHEQQKKEMDEFAKGVDELLEQKITERSLLVGGESSESVEIVHYGDDANNEGDNEEDNKNNNKKKVDEDKDDIDKQIRKEKTERKRTGQMVFGYDGKIAEPPKKIKKVVKKK
ncbi:Nucleoplasmin-like domain-containing protein [Entamoeba marina]